MQQQPYLYIKQYRIDSFAMGRAGAFSANFNPTVLDEFRSFCAGRGERYTKTLEKLAIAYLETKGELLRDLPAPDPSAEAENFNQLSHLSNTNQELLRRITRLEENDEFNAEAFETIFKRLEEIEKSKRERWSTI